MKKVSIWILPFLVCFGLLLWSIEKLGSFSDLIVINTYISKDELSQLLLLTKQSSSLESVSWYSKKENDVTTTLGVHASVNVINMGGNLSKILPSSIERGYLPSTIPIDENRYKYAIIDHENALQLNISLDDEDSYIYIDDERYAIAGILKQKNLAQYLADNGQPTIYTTGQPVENSTELILLFNTNGNYFVAKRALSQFFEKAEIKYTMNSVGYHAQSIIQLIFCVIIVQAIYICFVLISGYKKEHKYNDKKSISRFVRCHLGKLIFFSSILLLASEYRINIDPAYIPQEPSLKSLVSCIKHFTIDSNNYLRIPTMYTCITEWIEAFVIIYIILTLLLISIKGRRILYDKKKRVIQRDSAN